MGIDGAQPCAAAGTVDIAGDVLELSNPLKPRRLNTNEKRPGIDGCGHDNQPGAVSFSCRQNELNNIIISWICFPDNRTS